MSVGFQRVSLLLLCVLLLAIVRRWKRKRWQLYLNTVSHVDKRGRSPQCPSKLNNCAWVSLITHARLERKRSTTNRRNRKAQGNRIHDVIKCNSWREEDILCSCKQKLYRYSLMHLETMMGIWHFNIGRVRRDRESLDLKINVERDAFLATQLYIIKKKKRRGRPSVHIGIILNADAKWERRYRGVFRERNIYVNCVKCITLECTTYICIDL